MGLICFRGFGFRLRHWLGPPLASILSALARDCFVAFGLRLFIWSLASACFIGFGLHLLSWFWPPLVLLVVASAYLIGFGLRLFYWLWPLLVLLAVAMVRFIGLGFAFWLAVSACFIVFGLLAPPYFIGVGPGQVRFYLV